MVATMGKGDKFLPIMQNPKQLSLGLALLALCGAVPVQAEVKSASDYGFEIAHKSVIKATPQQVYAMLGKPARWWSSAANLSMSLKVGACFCEAIPKGKGGVEHARIIYAQPGEMLRLSGGFGPLQSEGASGALTFALKPVDGGTEVSMIYVIGGYLRFGPRTIAPAVDRVMGEQLAGLKRAIEG
jgi:uncharacterized protein YndB with AHSA1/START domain